MTFKCKTKIDSKMLMICHLGNVLRRIHLKVTQMPVNILKLNWIFVVLFLCFTNVIFVFKLFPKHKNGLLFPDTYLNFEISSTIELDTDELPDELMLGGPNAVCVIVNFTTLTFWLVKKQTSHFSFLFLFNRFNEIFLKPAYNITLLSGVLVSGPI